MKVHRLYAQDTPPPKTLLQRALQYHSIPGFEPIPLVFGQKKPLDGDGWQNREPRTEVELRALFGNGQPLNIGTRLGGYGLVDADKDCREAIVLAPYFLPETGFVFGRASARMAHHFYYADPAMRTRIWKDLITRENILELRCLKTDGTKGLQTMLPGSLRRRKKEDPPQVGDEWVDFDKEGVPQNVEAKVLLASCVDLVAAIWMARLFPKGGRNEVFLAFAGMLALGGFPKERAIGIHQGIFRLLWPQDPWLSQAAVQVEQTYSKWGSGQSVTGFTRLEQLGFDRKHLQTIEAGLELTKARNNGFSTQSTQGQQGPINDWKQLLVRGENNRVISNVVNVALCLTHHPAMCGRLSFDEFLDDVMVGPDPPAGIESGRLTEAGYIEVRCWVEQHFLSRAPKEIVRDGLLKAARARRTHPIKEYLEQLQWDGTKRLGRLFPHYFRSEELFIKESERSEEELNQKQICWEAIARMFMVSAIARIFEPGCQVDHTLVLEGEQGIGKSQALQTLFSREWFTDQMPDINVRDASLQLQGKWCIEFAEFSSLQRASPAAVKNFLTRSTEHYRAVWGTKAEGHPRQCVFAATVNPDEYLTDTTGNRRYWPVKCGVVRLDQLRQDRDQLWAEALWLYRQYQADPLNHDLQWWPAPSLAELLRTEQEDREITDPWTEPIGQWLKDRSAPARITTCWLLEKLNVPKPQQTKSMSMRVAEILRHKYHYRRRISGPQSYYIKPL